MLRPFQYPTQDRRFLARQVEQVAHSAVELERANATLTKAVLQAGQQSAHLVLTWVSTATLPVVPSRAKDLTPAT